MGALLLRGAGIGPAELREAISRQRTLGALLLGFRAALAAALFDLVSGVALAWVLARHRFPGRRPADAMVNLPFALPTAVAGLALTGFAPARAVRNAARSSSSPGTCPT